jgi:hypothetical protein
MSQPERTKTMKFNICNGHSGVDLGDYEAPDMDAALDAMAKDAGYENYRIMCSITDPEDLDAEVERMRSQLIVTQIQ